jgi:hypothetical protein
MMAALLLAALSGPAPAFGDEQAYAAIWQDLHWNAFLSGNIPDVTWTWLFGHNKGPAPTIKIRRLKCQGRGSMRRCSFALERVPDPGASAEDRREVPVLSCSAPLAFFRTEEPPAWEVIHRPPAEGHSHTTTQMRCWRTRAR